MIICYRSADMEDDSMQNGEKFLYLVRMTFLEKFSYAKAVWINMAGTMVSIIIYYYLWKYVFMNRNELAGFTMAQMVTYVILSRILSAQFGEGINMDFSDWINTGNIGMELLRPVSLQFILFARRVGEFCFFTLFQAVPVLFLSFLLLGGAGPESAGHVCLFLVSVGISVGIMFFFEFMVGLCSFYTLSPYGMAFTKRALLAILSGGVVPLFLFPGWIGEILNYLPFAGMVSIPVNIFLGKYSIQSALFYIGLQCFWVIILLLLTQGLYHKAIKKVVVQGG